MKPTKEQLADPKWWDAHAKPEDKYHYTGKVTGNCFFSHHFDDSLEGYRLISKRPEAKWVPEPGEEIEASDFGKWVKVRYICEDEDGDYLVINMDTLDGFYTVTIRPIKTQREEFIDKAKSMIKNMDADDIILAGKLYDAGCRFELTEKD